MRHLSYSVKVLFALVLLLPACGDNSSDGIESGRKNKNESTDPSRDSDNPDDTEEGEARGDDTEEDTHSRTTDSEQLDLNQPPGDLPERCRLNTEVVAGEDVGRFEVSIGGDARFPDIDIDPNSGRAAMVWAYMPSEGEGDESRRWGIQSRRYDCVIEGEDIIARELGDVLSVTTAAESPLAEHPSIVLTDGGYVVVFRDARYDEHCDPTSTEGYEACRRFLALMTLDKDGAPSMDEPVLLSDGAVKNRPVIARSPDGTYVAAWTELEESDYRIKTMRISADLTPGAIHELPLAADGLEGPSVATNDQVAVIVYSSQGQHSVVSGVWGHGQDLPESEVHIISDSFDHQFRPRIAAGESGFMVSYSGNILLYDEVFLQPLDATGEVFGASERATFAYKSVSASELAWNGETYALVWESSTENGASAWPNSGGLSSAEICVYEGCSEQIFATLVNKDGKITAESVLISRDPNRSERTKILWDGVGWTMVWQAWRKNRWQVLHGQMLCD